MTQSNGSIVIEDYSKERSTFNPNVQDLDAAGALFGSISTDLDEIKDAIQPLIRGVIRHSTLSFKYPESDDPVTDVEAARETKWLVTYRDTTEYLGALNTVPNPGFNQLFSFEIPTAKRSLLSGNSDTLDITTGGSVGAVAKAALEPNIRSPYNRAASGTPTNRIEEIKFVGRNN